MSKKWKSKICMKDKNINLLPYYLDNCIEAGCDEAGRGCLAGAVFAAAVILPYDFDCPELNDSKKLTEKQRKSLRYTIENGAIAWAVAQIETDEIDKINILKASIKAMHSALDKLQTVPAHIIVDGNKFVNYKDIPHKTIIKGDGKYLSIAAASVLAKTHRDEYMSYLHLQYPQYQWNINKGYPTKKHREAIKEYGISPFHRRSFRLLEKQINIDFNS